MRRAMLATLLLTAMALSGAPGTSADGDAATRTTRIPGTDLAVTLSLEWRIWSPTHDRADERIYASDVPGDRGCVFELLTDASSAVAMADETTEALERHKAEVQRATFDVPAGTAVRASYRFETLPDEPRFVRHEYYLDVPQGVVAVYCGAGEPPADGWLSIVEAITPLPDQLPVSAPFDPRVEVPRRGLAVDFPAEWLVRSWPGPGPVLGGSLILRAVTPDREDGSGGYECGLEDDTAVPGLSEVASLDEWRDTLIAIDEEHGRRATEPVVTQVDLPSGAAVRADWGAWSDMPATAWILGHDGRHATLFCRAMEPPADGWRSVAESLEFLPGVE